MLDGLFLLIGLMEQWNEFRVEASRSEQVIIVILGWITVDSEEGRVGEEPAPPRAPESPPSDWSLACMM